MARRVLVTGSTGFVGSMLCDELVKAGYVVRAAQRTKQTVPTSVSDKVVTGDIGANTDWREALQDVDVVIHAAARAHVLGDHPGNANLYIESNAHGTRRLAEAAAAAGVRRLIFLSTVKVNGESSGAGVFTAQDPPQPQDTYGQSKRLAEESLQTVAKQTGMQVVCVRSPLVYGPGVRANFLRLLRWVDGQRPLPLAALNNRRSLVSLWNLCSLLVHVVDSPAAAGTWMVSDGEDLSTPELIRRIARPMNRHVRLFSVPPRLLYWAGATLGKGAEVARLCDSLAVDLSHTRKGLGWAPPLSVDESLARTVQWYLEVRQSHDG